MAGIAAVLVVAWLAGGFERVGLDANIVLALVLGIFFSSLLGVGLMALMFHSERSGQDAEAHTVLLRDDEAAPDITIGVPQERDKS
jgi:hypothetical protein